MRSAEQEQRKNECQSQASLDIARELHHEASEGPGAGGQAHAPAATATHDNARVQDPSQATDRDDERQLVAARLALESPAAARLQLGADESARERVRRKCRLLHVLTAAQSGESVKSTMFKRKSFSGVFHHFVFEDFNFLFGSFQFFYDFKVKKDFKRKIERNKRSRIFC